MLCALVRNGVVDKVLDLNEEQVQEQTRLNDYVVDVSDMMPIPEVGWFYNAGVFTIPQNRNPERKITKLAFMNRLRSNELGAIYTIANTQGHPLQINFQIFRDMLMAATFIDLGRADTQANVNTLVAVGILTSARALEILTAPIQRHEIPPT